MSWMIVESYPQKRAWKNGTNRVIHRVAHIIHKKKRKLCRYSTAKKRTLVLYICNKVVKKSKRTAKKLDISNVKISKILKGKI